MRMWSGHVSTSINVKTEQKMPLATKIAGFAAFGVLVRAYALGIQRRNPLERMLQPASSHIGGVVSLDLLPLTPLLFVVSRPTRSCWKCGVLWGRGLCCILGRAEAGASH